MLPNFYVVNPTPSKKGKTFYLCLSVGCYYKLPCDHISWMPCIIATNIPTYGLFRQNLQKKTVFSRGIFSWGVCAKNLKLCQSVVVTVVLYFFSFLFFPNPKLAVFYFFIFYKRKEWSGFFCKNKKIEKHNTTVTTTLWQSFKFFAQTPCEKMPLEKNGFCAGFGEKAHM